MELKDDALEIIETVAEVEDEKEERMEGIPLHQTWFAEGKNPEIFAQYLEEMGKMTHFEVIEPSQLFVLSYEGFVKDGSYIFQDAEPNSPELKMGKVAKEKLDSSPKELFGQFENEQMLVYTGGKIFYVSYSFIATMLSRVGLRGDVQEPSKRRDAYIAEKLGRMDKKRVTFVYRNNDNDRVAVALHSGKYGAVKQTWMLEIQKLFTKSLGKADVMKWHVDHNISYITILFPEKGEEVAAIYGLPEEAKIIPGITLETSDVGDASVTALGCWQIDGVISYHTAYTRVHKGKIDMEEVEKGIEEKIFDQYTLLPERLCELMTIEAAPGVIENLYEKIIDEPVIGKVSIKKIIGDKNRNDLLDEMKIEVNPLQKYTLYDVAMAFLQLPKRLIDTWSPDAQTWKSFQTACGKVPYMKLEELLKKAGATLFLAP